MGRGRNAECEGGVNVEKCGWNIIKNSSPRDDTPDAAKIRGKSVRIHSNRN